MTDDVDASDAEIREYMMKLWPDTWWLGWSRVQYESIRQEIIAQKKRKMNKTKPPAIPARGLWDLD